jgi:hypothetical protein
MIDGFGVVPGRSREQVGMALRESARFIIVPRRTRIAHLRRPWRATADEDGTIPSLWRYEAAAAPALKLVNLRRSTISHYALRKVRSRSLKLEPHATPQVCEWRLARVGEESR